MSGRALLIACGALAKELVELQRLNGWQHLKIQCLPAELHNYPQKIPGAVEDTIRKYRADYKNIFIAYADCGTGGLLDQVCERYGVERIPGVHCYEFFAGKDVFSDFASEELGTFYLTDFLVRHFDRVMVEGLGLDKHPELKDMYFGNYKRLVYLAQERSDELSQAAREQAEYLGLDYAEHYTGLKPIESIMKEHVVQWQN
jgi:hypothetical protein